MRAVWVSQGVTPWPQSVAQLEELRARAEGRGRYFASQFQDVEIKGDHVPCPWGGVTFRLEANGSLTRLARNVDSSG